MSDKFSSPRNILITHSPFLHMSRSNEQLLKNLKANMPRNMLIANIDPISFLSFLCVTCNIAITKNLKCGEAEKMLTKTNMEAKEKNGRESTSNSFDFGLSFLNVVQLLASTISKGNPQYLKKENSKKLNCR